jgi:hypothetical protein
MASRRFKDGRHNRDGGAFLALPLSVLNSRAYLDLTYKARALLLDLLSQYNGKNNGDLCACFKVMSKRGCWKSEQTLFAARRELEASGLVTVTRMGARPNRATLYAVTFFGLNENPKLEITNRSFPRGAYLAKDRPKVLIVGPPKNATLTPTGALAAAR